MVVVSAADLRKSLDLGEATIALQPKLVAVPTRSPTVKPKDEQQGSNAWIWGLTAAGGLVVVLGIGLAYYSSRNYHSDSVVHHESTCILNVLRNCIASTDRVRRRRKCRFSFLNIVF